MTAHTLLPVKHHLGWAGHVNVWFRVIHCPWQYGVLTLVVACTAYTGGVSEVCIVKVFPQPTPEKEHVGFI